MVDLFFGMLRLKVWVFGIMGMVGIDLGDKFLYIFFVFIDLKRKLFFIFNMK